MDPLAMNILGVNQLVSSKLNKVNDGATNEQEGVVGEKVDVLALDLSDEELIQLSRKWTAKYAGYETSL